jgi:hypothetical protein
MKTSQQALSAFSTRLTGLDLYSFLLTAQVAFAQAGIIGGN